jgi:hypothetical protein
MFIIQTNRCRLLLQAGTEFSNAAAEGSVSGKRMAGMSALRTALSIDCAAQLAALLSHDQHHPL